MSKIGTTNIDDVLDFRLDEVERGGVKYQQIVVIFSYDEKLDQFVNKMMIPDHIDITEKRKLDIIFQAGKENMDTSPLLAFFMYHVHKMQGHKKTEYYYKVVTGMGFDPMNFKYEQSSLVFKLELAVDYLNKPDANTIH